MIKKKEWKEFKEAGLLWFVNSMLHIFGWAIVFEQEDGEIINVYPARCKFRGFNEESNDKGYYKISKYMAEHADELLQECEPPKEDKSKE